MGNSVFISQVKWCWSLSKGYNFSFAIFYLAELLIIASSLIFIVTSKRAIDYAVDGSRDQMLHMLYLAAVLIFLGIVLKVISTKCNELSKMKLLRDLQNNVAESQMYSNWEYIKSWSTGDIQFRIQRDCTEIVQMISQVFPNFTLTAIRLVASMSLLWVLDSRLALIIIAITPLFVFSKLYYKRFRHLNKTLKSIEGSLSHIINENLKFRMLIRSLGIEQQRMHKLHEEQNDIVKVKTEMLNFSMISQTIIKTTVSAGYLFTFIWGVLGLSAGTITFGTMTAFLQLVGRVQTPMLGMLGFFPSFVSFGVSVERVQEVVFGKLERREKQIQISDLKKIEITDLGFRYGDKDVINDLNLSFFKGQSTAILGASGRGKTTLIRLLLSVIKPDKGTIKLYFDGQVEEIDSAFRTNFGYVPQGDKLFSGTIRDNLLLGDNTISENKLSNALFHACAEFIYELPEKLDTIVGESGYGLSEGQSQRIAIARALLRDTQVWLFDEVTSSLDSKTSILLMERLKMISREKIFVFVTHDRQLAEYCNQVYYLN